MAVTTFHDFPLAPPGPRTGYCRSEEIARHSLMFTETGVPA